MSKYNRGEWSELYVTLFLMEHPKLQLVNETLDFISDNVFLLEKILFPQKSSIDYCVVALNGEQGYDEENADEEVTINKNMLTNAREIVYCSITDAPVGEGSFSIIEKLNNNAFKIDNENKNKLSANCSKRNTANSSKNIKDKVTELCPKIKARSLTKIDLLAQVKDLTIDSSVKIGYNIKSMLGSPATLLNASSATNFEYKVSGLNDKQVKYINSIKTRTKLRDKLTQIYEFGAQVEFSKVLNETFENNLLMLDSLMPKILADALLRSYKSSNKNILKLFETSKFIQSETLAKKKLGDLLQAISFGMFPNKLWDGTFEANGGILVVKKDGDVVLLDLIYHTQEVLQFLISETKLDSPSSSRYDMLHLLPDPEHDGCYKFTLNLQIRYKH